MGALEGFQRLRIEILHAVIGTFVVGPLLDIIQHIVYGFLGVVACNGGFYIRQKLPVVLDCLWELSVTEATTASPPDLVVSAKLKFELYCLL